MTKGEVTIEWKLAEPRRLRFDHWDNDAGKWTLIEIDFQESLKREHCRVRRENALMSEFMIGGLSAVYMYGNNHGVAVREIV